MAFKISKPLVILLSWFSLLSCFPQLFFQTLTLFHKVPNLPLPHPLCTHTGFHISRKAGVPGIDFLILTLHLQSCPLRHQSILSLLWSEDNRGSSFLS